MQKYARIFVHRLYLFWEANSFPRAKTVSYEEQIMSKDKYPNIFLPQMEVKIVFIFFKSFSKCTQFWKLVNILGKQFNQWKVGSNNEKFSMNSFPFIKNKADLLSITFFAEIIKQNKKIQQRKSITSMTIDEDRWKSMNINTHNFWVINFNRFRIIID